MLNQLIYRNNQLSSGGSGDFAPDLLGFSPNDTGNVNLYTVPNDILCSKNGRLIYSDGCGVKLWTWWDFDQSEEVNSINSVNAYLNDRLVCESHATWHIIDYFIDREKIYRGKSCVTIYVHMSMEDSGNDDSNWDGGAACTHRLWGGDGGESGFYEADQDHKSEKAGTCGGGATFKVVFDIKAGTYRIF